MITAALAAVAVWLLLPVPALRLRPHALPQPERGGRRRPGASPRSVPASAVASALLGVGVAVAVGGPSGVALGLLATAGAFALIRRAESAPDRQTAAIVRRQVPVSCDLLASVLASGAESRSALRAVAAAVGPPASADLDAVLGRLALGADARTAWASCLNADSPWSPIAAAMVRSAESGAPLVESLRRVSADLRLRQRTELLARARVLGVRTVLPLGVCFLPAFICLGIVPVVASLIAGVL